MSDCVLNCYTHTHTHRRHVCLDQHMNIEMNVHRRLNIFTTGDIDISMIFT